MTILRLVLWICLMAVPAICQQRSPQQTLKPPASCPVTVPPASPFTPPSPYHSEVRENFFWLGTEKLWTILRKDGVWARWQPRETGKENRLRPLTTKTAWVSVDFDLRKEPQPDLTVTGRRLDGNSRPLLTTEATNVLTGPTTDNAEMSVGVYVPTPGCWEITGEYRGQKLSYVVWVTAQPEAGKVGGRKQ